MVDKIPTPRRPEDVAELETSGRLRQRALQEAGARHVLIPDDLSSLSGDRARSLLHDLRVHRIELEMQNEELRESQEELEVARARYVALYDLAPVGYVTIGEDGIVLETNLTAAGLLDATKSAIVKQPWTQFVFPADQDVYLMHRRKLFSSGAPHACELRLIKPDGESFWVRLEARVAEGDGGTRVCRTVLSEISERKLGDEALRISEARLRAVLENSSDALLTLEPPNWSFSSCNAAGLAMFGARDEQDLLSRTFAQRSRERQPDNRVSQEWVGTLLGAALRDGSASFEWTFQRNEGEAFAATVAVARVETDGAPFLQATVRDQSEARKLRATSAQTERLASMGLLAASMGHEINNPLAYVLSNVEDLAQLLPKIAAVSARCVTGLRSAVGDEGFRAIVGEDAALLEPAALHEASEWARDALHGALRVTRISKALGSFGRAEPSDLGKIDLQRAIESALAASSKEIRARATLTLDFAPLPLVWASEDRLSQVFLNLLINALHATDDSQTRAITVRTWTEDGSVCAAVEDTGPGITPAHVSRIFEPFFSTKRIGAGSGLGLSICRSIIDEFGGDIRVETELDKGTRFVVRLPIWADAAVLRSVTPA